MNTEPDWEQMPSTEELIAARQTLQKLQSAIYRPAMEEYAQSNFKGQDIWGGVVEAKRMIAVTVSWLSYWKPEYMEIWERMIEDA